MNVQKGCWFRITFAPAFKIETMEKFQQKTNENVFESTLHYDVDSTVHHCY